MKAEDFIKEANEKADKDYGLCPPPTPAKGAINILIDHFLGEDWYVTMPISPEQLYTEAVYEILNRNPKGFKGKLKLWLGV